MQTGSSRPKPDHDCHDHYFCKKRIQQLAEDARKFYCRRKLQEFTYSNWLSPQRAKDFINNDDELAPVFNYDKPKDWDISDPLQRKYIELTLLSIIIISLCDVPDFVPPACMFSLAVRWTRKFPAFMNLISEYLNKE